MIKLTKNTWSKGTVNTLVLGTAGPRQEAVRWEAGGVLGRLLGRKYDPKGVFLKTMKIENGTHKQVFITVRHRDPLKTVPGSSFEKNNAKTIGKSIGFDGPKPLKSIEKHKRFLIFRSFTKMITKMMPKGTSKVMGLPGSIIPFVF